MAEQIIPIGHVEESDTLGNTLHHAALRGSRKSMKRVLDKGINVDYPNDEGQSPLFCACHANNEGVVDYLLSAGANPNEKSNSGLTPVIVTGYSGNVKILIKLLNAGGDLRLHDNHGRNVKDWAMLQPVPKKRMKMLEFLDKARLFAMSSSGQDLLLKKAPSNVLHKALHRQNTITKMIRNRIGRHSVHDNLEKMATSHHSLGFGQQPLTASVLLNGIPNEIVANNNLIFKQVYANGSEETGFLSAIPLISESSLRHDPDGETYNNGAFSVMESMWWDYTEVTIKRLHRDIDPFQGGVVDLLINEIEHIGKLRHPHVLTLMGVCQTNNLDGLVLIYERIGQGSLFNCLHQKMERLPSQIIQDVAVQMCNAIIFIHLRGLVHCAITSHAISVVNNNTFKLGNFEYMVESSKCELGKKNSVVTNTNENCIYNWLAPEVIFNLPPSFYCDMYSYCAVIWEIFHGDIPWDSQSSEAIRSQYSKGNSLRVYQGKIAEYYKVILEFGLELDPNKRKLSFLHVRDLLCAAPKDARYYLKTHFQNLNQSEQKGPKANQTVKPSAPQIQTKQAETKAPEPAKTSQTVDQALREKHERRRQKEKERARQMDDSDFEPNLEVERQKQRREEENRRIKRSRDGEIRGRSEEKRKQYGFSTGSRQVKGQNVDDRNNHCSSLQNSWNLTHENLDGSPRKAAEPRLFKTEGLDWEILPEEEGEEYLYTVQVKRHPSPSKQPTSPFKTPVSERNKEETNVRPPCTPPRKDVIEVTSSEDNVSSTENPYAKGRELGKVTSSMGRFSYLTLGDHQKSRSYSVKPACHTTGALLADEYSTAGKLTTAGSVFALYNDHSPNLPMGQLSHREHPDYAELRRRLLSMKQPSAPPIKPESSWFEGKGSVRDLAKVFQQQIQEHGFYQSVLDGKLTREHESQPGTGVADYSNHAKKGEAGVRGQDKEDKASFGSLSTVSVSDTGETDGRCDTDTTSTFTSTSLADSKDIKLSSSRESDLVSQWVDHEIRKIKKNLSKSMVFKSMEDIKREKSPDIFGTYRPPETTRNMNAEDSSPSHVLSTSSSDQDYCKQNVDQRLETGDHLKDPEVREFYFDDELYARRGRRSTKIYFDEETSLTSIAESPDSGSLPMETCLKANSMSSVEDKPDTATQNQSTNRKKISKIPTSRSRLVPKTPSPDGVYSNIVTVTSSLDRSGLHQITHKMKNLKTRGTKTLVNDTVSARKVVTKLRSAN